MPQMPRRSSACNCTQFPNFVIYSKTAILSFSKRPSLILINKTGDLMNMIYKYEYE